jgi:hypothetical protein
MISYAELPEPPPKKPGRSGINWDKMKGWLSKQEMRQLPKESFIIQGKT